MIAPSVTYELESHLTPEECRRRIASVVFVVKPFTVFQMKPPRGGGYLFQGSLKANQFSIRRLDASLPSRNQPFLPTIRGEMEPNGGGTLIRLKISVNPILPLFLMVWFTLFSSFCYMDLTSPGANAPKPLIIFIGLGAAVTTFIRYAKIFVPAAQEYRHILVELLELRQKQSHV